MIGKLGRRPPKNAPALKLSSVLSGVLPDHPATADYATGLKFDMLGNDQYGDCVAVAWANNRYIVTSGLGTPNYPSQAEVYKLYATQNPRFPTDDDGMDIQTALEYLQKTGGPDGVKAVAFAKVDVSNEDEIRAAVAIFGSVIYGIKVTAANETEFDHGQAWDYVSGSEDLGGHGIAGAGYDPRLRFVTWAAETEFTDSFVQRQLEEAWVVVWPENLGSKAFLQGVDQTALAADYKALTGKDLPIPTPAPTPTPAPGAASFPVAADLAARIHQLAIRAKMTDQAWLDHHLRTYFKMN